MEINRIAVVGSTGSIGTQALDVIAHSGGRFRAQVLVAGSRVDTLVQQALLYKPALAVIADESLLWKLRNGLEGSGIAAAAGQAAVNDAVTRDDVDMVLTATVGYSGLAPTLHAIGAGKDIALANKETLVVAGDIVTAAARHHGVSIYPVDSEHSAIYQCLRGENPDRVKRLIITASGGPFRTFGDEQLRAVTPGDALRHPNWSMGAKITIDSATMVNKAFEIIEAHWLFGIEGARITPLVHPQSVVHSMVEMVDGAVMAQLGTPDMRLPIRLALARGERMASPDGPLSLERLASLTFERPDSERFPGIRWGHYALERGGNSACVINAANEVAVAAFLRGEIPFLRINGIIAETVARIPHIARSTYDDYVTTNAEARRVAGTLVKQSTVHTTPID